MKSSELKSNHVRGSINSNSNYAGEENNGLSFLTPPLHPTERIP